MLEIESNKRIKLIYVASTGRSGSTLLEMLLGAHPKIANCGEIQIFPHEIQEEVVHQPCSCGSTIQSCYFWNTLKERINPFDQAKPHIHHFRESYSKGKLFRRELLNILFDRISASQSEKMRIYSANNYSLFTEYLALLGSVCWPHPRITETLAYKAFWVYRGDCSIPDPVEPNILNFTLK